MGVRVIETDSASDSYDDEDCSTCGGAAAAAAGGVGVKMASSFQFGTRDLVGNCKEFRVENNSRDLRIIGNGNRIRIGKNSGSLQIIGNNSRLKIQNNSGQLKYTGNDGRVYLGSDSQQQSVDYIGCNGILKVVKAESLNVQGSSSRKKYKTKSEPSSPKTGDAKTPPSPPRQAEQTVEINSNVTIVNNLGGIVIKNAINVRI